MNYQHKKLAEGRWDKLLLLEKLANIGGEVGRALAWQAKNNAVYSRQAAERALELMDLTLDSITSFAHLKELARIREALVDYFFGTNQFMSTPASWKKYFSHFTYAARKTY